MHSIKLPNGEREQVAIRYKIPGKNRGFLCVCKSGNCYVTFRRTAIWVMDEEDYDPAFIKIREKMLEYYETARKKRDAVVLAEFIKSRMGSNR